MQTNFKLDRAFGAILYIKLHTYYDIYKKYGMQWQYINNVTLND